MSSNDWRLKEVLNVVSNPQFSLRNMDTIFNLLHAVSQTLCGWVGKERIHNVIAGFMEEIRGWAVVLMNIIKLVVNLIMETQRILRKNCRCDCYIVTWRDRLLWIDFFFLLVYQSMSFVIYDPITVIRHATWQCDDHTEMFLESYCHFPTFVFILFYLYIFSSFCLIFLPLWINCS